MARPPDANDLKRLQESRQFAQRASEGVPMKLPAIGPRFPVSSQLALLML